MVVCLQDANFSLGGLVPALVFPVSVSSTKSINVFDNVRSMFFVLAGKRNLVIL